MRLLKTQKLCRQAYRNGWNLRRLGKHCFSETVKFGFTASLCMQHRALRERERGINTERERERETVKLLHLKLTLNWVTLFNLTGYFHLLCRHHRLCLSSERDFLCCLFQHLSFRSPPHLNNCTHASGFLQTFYCVSIWIWAQSWLPSSRENGVSLPPRDACLKV